MANSKAQSRSARTVAAVSATPTSRSARKPNAKAADPDPAEDELTEEAEQEEAKPGGQPLWLQVTSLVLAVRAMRSSKTAMLRSAK